MANRHNATIQFLSEGDYRRLCALALVWGMTLGDTVAKLVKDNRHKADGKS